MPPDQRWRYILGTILLAVAMLMAIAACFGVAAETTAFKAKAFGVEFEGASILPFAIVIFVAAALFLLKARAETPTKRTVKHYRAPTRDRAFGFMHGDNNTTHLLLSAGEWVSTEVPNKGGIRLRRTVVALLLVGLSVLIYAGIHTTVVAS